jgi:hypothetical protein
MSWSKEEALTDPAVREPMMFVSEFRFSLRDIPTEITIRLYRPLFSEEHVARCSHRLSIPKVSASPAATPDEAAAGEGLALHNAVDEFVSLYNRARAEGLTPEASWLTPNADFC